MDNCINYFEKMFSNIKFKKRIIIHIPLIRRDTGISMLMKAVFESNNYKVILCSASTLSEVSNYGTALSYCWLTWGS